MKDNKVDYSNRIITWVLLSFAFSFMLCVFAPIDIYYSNIHEYWFSFSQLLNTMIIPFGLLFVVFLLPGLILWKVKFYYLILAVFLSLYVYFYIQGNFIPRPYGVLNGTEIVWDEYSKYGLLSIGLFIILTVLCILLCTTYQQKISSVVKIVCLGIFAIQIVTIISTLAIHTNDSDKTKQNIVSNKDQFNFSAEKNIILFILDTFDGNDLNYLLQHNEDEIKDTFRDFTYYKDTLGGYPTTRCALPLILTGKWYENQEPFMDYIQKSYENNPIYETLEEYGYQIDAYATHGELLSRSSGFYNNVEEGRYEVSDSIGLSLQIMNMVGFNYSPHQLKHLFIFDTNSISKYRKINSEDEPYTTDVIQFYNQYLDKGIQTNRKTPVFKVYHTDGVHAPYTFDKRLSEDNDKLYTSYDEAAGNVEILQKILSELKEKGIYESSTIIVMADHGHIGFSQNPIFMIKNNDEKHDFYLSDEKMTWDHLSDIWQALVKGDTVNELFIHKLNAQKTERRYLFYQWNDNWNHKYMPGMEEMVCIGQADDYNSMISTERFYIPIQGDYKYELGTELNFEKDTVAYNYCAYGFAANGRMAKKASLLLDVSNQKYNNLLMTIQTADSEGPAEYSILANGNLVGKTVFTSNETIQVVIPKEYMEHEELLQIEFQQTEWMTIEKRKNTSNTMVSISSINVVSTNDFFDKNMQIATPTIQQKKVYEFRTDKKDGIMFTCSGFSIPEEKGIWMTGDLSIIKFRVEKITDKIISIFIGEMPNEQEIKIYVNNHYVANLITGAQNKKSFFCPAEYIEKDGLVEIIFEHPDAISPLSQGLSDDSRELALYLNGICIQDADNLRIKNGDIISFDGNNALECPYIVSGFSIPEENGNWTNSNTVEMILPLAYPIIPNMMLLMDCFVYHDQQRVMLYVNEQRVADFIARNDTEKIQITLPNNATSSGTLFLRFELPDAQSPKQNGESEDDRTLGLFFKTIMLKQSD